MALVDLIREVAAPKNPVATGPLAWGEIEARLGCALPDDYKEYIETFGLGCLDGFLYVFSPFSENRNLNLFAQVETRLAALRELKASSRDEVQYPLFPETGGLLPWGASDNGDVLFWLTEGQANEWGVVINAGRDARCEEYAGGMAYVLSQLLSGAAVSKIFPVDFPSNQPAFVSLA